MAVVNGAFGLFVGQTEAYFAVNACYPETHCDMRKRLVMWTER
jgi:hypothetical protein